ncbi:hypothetical protein R75465_04712 [Paraburkholderia aspalathi]|nr:hypothetical protein R75465_04712 [Paraburkholderia aspalathi]
MNVTDSGFALSLTLIVKFCDRLLFSLVRHAGYQEIAFSMLSGCLLWKMRVTAVSECMFRVQT